MDIDDLKTQYGGHNSPKRNLNWTCHTIPLFAEDGHNSPKRNLN